MRHMCTIYCLECEILWYGWNPNFGLVCPFDQVRCQLLSWNLSMQYLSKKKKSQCNLSDLAPTHKRHCC